jgi:long-chain acyl-CoA synthetase
MFPSIVHLFLASVERFADRPALLSREGGSYRTIRYRELGGQVETLAHGLAAEGVEAGDRVAILSYNRPQWPAADLAILALRAVTVPINHMLPPPQIAYVLRDAGVTAIFVENEMQLRKVERIRSECPALRLVFAFDPVTPGRAVISFDALLEHGKRHRGEHPGFFRTSVDGIDPAGLCSLVYTSGTTGDPKGVMLHHRGFVADVIASESVFGLEPDDVFLSFLPLSYLYERVAGHWCALYRGCSIAYAEDVATVARDLLAVRPTVMVGVPRVYEKLRARVEARIEAGSAVTRWLFHAAVRDGLRYHRLRQEGRAGPLLALRYALAERLVLRRIRNVLGGRFRFPISGGAPLSPDTLRFFNALGLRLIEGYGMTETHLIITLTPPGRTRYGSCGQPIPGVEVRIAGDGEVLVRGPTVMAGYHGKEAETREAIDAEGWLHTGDIGHLDRDGYLYITDRKKNLIVTAGGKNIAPAPIENALKASPYIEDVCLIGDRRKFIAAVVVPAFEAIEAWAARQGLGGLERRALAAHPAVRERVMEDIRRLQSEFADAEQVKRCLLLEEPLSVARGELTPTLKIKRRVIEQRFRDRIDALYS